MQLSIFSCLSDRANKMAYHIVITSRYMRSIVSKNKIIIKFTEKMLHFYDNFHWPGSGAIDKGVAVNE